MDQPPHPVRSTPPRRLRTIWLVGLLLVIVVLFTVKGRMTSPVNIAAPDPSMPAAVQFAQARAANQPTLLFFHSNSCASCKTMTATIAEVWPAFQPQVVLVSVNVYDQQNIELLQTHGIRVIPTMVFIDRNGGRQVEIGTMRPEVLQQRLAMLAAGG